MALAIALFASVVLVLAVYNKQFRVGFFWFAGISAAAAGLLFLSVRLYRKHEVKQRVETERRIQTCVARFPVHYVLDGQRMSVSAIASACARNPDFAPDPNSPHLAKIVEIHGGGTLQIVPPQKFSADGDPDLIPIIYLGHHQTFVLKCGSYGEQETNIVINQGLVSCPATAEVQECTQWDDKADKWAKYIELSLGDCTQNGCVVYRGKKIIGGVSRNEITNAQWHSCG